MRMGSHNKRRLAVKVVTNRHFLRRCFCMKIDDDGIGASA